MAEVIAGLFLLGGFFYTAKTFEASEASRRLAEDSNITDRFLKAVEQLGSDALEVRIGALYSLERIASDSPRDHWPIMEVLVHYITTKDEAHQLPFSKWKPDLKAAMAIIIRRRAEFDPPKSTLYLSGLNLSGGFFQDANFFRANLGGPRTSLRGALLNRANLRHAMLMQANLERATLWGADLRDAGLGGAILKDVNFQGAQLDGAQFVQSVVSSPSREKRFLRAHLEGADLTGAIGLTAEQVGDACLDPSSTKLPPLSDFTWAAYRRDPSCNAESARGQSATSLVDSANKDAAPDD